ncbi:MAG TPA: galactokinase [Acidisarcina sp.]|nr:galactokinase [Acidisarcina sp.]
MQDPNVVRKFHSEHFQAEPSLFAAPGRVNIIGEHTDYAEGFVMPAAIDFTTVAGISPRTDGRVVIYSLNFGEEAAFDLAALPAGPSHHWSDYPIGVVTVLKSLNAHPRAFSMTLSGDVPLGAGLSSSASVEVATFLAVQSLSSRQFAPPDVARLCQRAENGFVGTKSGIMDQFIACCGAENHALLLDCRDLSFRLAPIPEDVSLVIANTMIKHSHAGGEYNTRRAEVEEGVEVLRKHRPEIRVLRDATIDDLTRWGSEMRPNVLKRCRHVVTENARTVAAADALERGDLKDLGRLMAEAHASYRDDFEGSVKEADLMVELANKLPGLIGARLTGGGFGGCTVNLVASSQAATFATSLQASYKAATGIDADVYLCHASAAARAL